MMVTSVRQLPMAKSRSCEPSRIAGCADSGEARAITPARKAPDLKLLRIAGAVPERLAELEYEPVGVSADRLVQDAGRVRIGGIAKRVAFAGEAEAGCFDLLPGNGWIDAVQGFRHLGGRA